MICRDEFNKLVGAGPKWQNLGRSDVLICELFFLEDETCHVSGRIGELDVRRLQFDGHLIGSRRLDGRHRIVEGGELRAGIRAHVMPESGDDIVGREGTSVAEFDAAPQVILDGRRIDLLPFVGRCGRERDRRRRLAVLPGQAT